MNSTVAPMAADAGLTLMLEPLNTRTAPDYLHTTTAQTRHIIEAVSACVPLDPGDLIATGTPEGVGPVVHGDLMEVEIEGLGVLESPVVRLD